MTRGQRPISRKLRKGDGRLAGRVHRVKAAVVRALGRAPAFADFDEPSPQGSERLGAPLVAGLLVLAGSITVVMLFPCMLAATVGYGLIAPAASHAALEPVPDLAGTAAALMNTVQMACMSLSSLAVALLFPRAGPFAMPATMAAVAGVAAPLLIGLVRSAYQSARQA